MGEYASDQGLPRQSAERCSPRLDLVDEVLYKVSGLQLDVVLASVLLRPLGTVTRLGLIPDRKFQPPWRQRFSLGPQDVDVP